MPNKCPYCEKGSLEQMQPPTGDSFFIGCWDEASKKIIIDQGIICDFYVCSSCGNIQLKRKNK